MGNASSEGSCESMLLLLSLLLSSTGGEIVCGDDDFDYDTSSLIDICRCTNNLRAPAPLSVPMISRLLLLTVEISASAAAGLQMGLSVITDWRLSSLKKAKFSTFLSFGGASTTGSIARKQSLFWCLRSTQCHTVDIRADSVINQNGKLPENF